MRGGVLQALRRRSLQKGRAMNPCERRWLSSFHHENLLGTRRLGGLGEGETITTETQRSRRELCTTNPSNLLPARGFLRISAIPGHALVATAYAAAFFVHRCSPRPSRGLSCPTRLRASGRPLLLRLLASKGIGNT